MTPGMVAADGAATEAEVARALGRAGVYRLLARAFADPARGRPADDTADLGRAARSLAGAVPALADSLDRLARSLEALDPATLADEHVFLFHRQVRCSPYEGAYGTPSLAGKSVVLADVAGFYAAFGVAPASAAPDTEDHIAAELEFMSVLALKEAYARAEGHEDGLEVTRRAAVGFLTDHLGRWAEPFADAVREASPLPFYAEAAGLLSAWIRHDVEALGARPLRAEGATDVPGDDAPFTCPLVDPEPTPSGETTPETTPTP